MLIVIFPSLQEACLQRLVKGLQTYLVLFKHVEREYPRSSVLPEVTHYSGLLISLIKGKVGLISCILVLLAKQVL